MEKWILTIDSSVIEGDTADQVINDLWSSARFGEPTIEEYRSGFARRLATYNGMVARSATNQELFDDLVSLQAIVSLPK